MDAECNHPDDIKVMEINRREQTCPKNEVQEPRRVTPDVPAAFDCTSTLVSPVGQSDLPIPVPQELHSRERSSSPRTDSATSTSTLVE